MLTTARTAGAVAVYKEFANVLVSTIDENPAIFSNLERGAQSKLAHAYNVFAL